MQFKTFKNSNRLDIIFFLHPSRLIHFFTRLTKGSYGKRGDIKALEKIIVGDTKKSQEIRKLLMPKVTKSSIHDYIV